jgi:sigma-B regulation protein RsbU (phosphoserine phosphatase)
MLITLQGPESGRKYLLESPVTVLGRQFDSTICLSGRAVSRLHAQILQRDGGFVVEDLNSSNGTFVNGKRLPPGDPVPLTERDTLQIGPHLFALRAQPTVATTEPNLVVREQVSALTLNQTIYGQDPAQKLQVVLDIAQHLARTLDLEPLVDKLLDHLMRLFPQADRAMCLFLEDDSFVVRGQRCRDQQDASVYPYSRTIVQRALEGGVGILSEDAQADKRFQASQTVTSLDLHSVICVPLIGHEGRRLGVIQIDRFRRGLAFRVEDLHLLTTISLQVTVALENANLHAERLQEERLHQELAFAREIQQGFLPNELEGFPKADFEIVGRVYPARQVAGDLYDFLLMPGDRVGFFIGDVSGKGMAAALFMVAVRTLSRHLAKEGRSPAETLQRLNAALAADNPSGMFVTLVHGVYTPGTGEIVLASGGHPPPLLRRRDGRVEDIPLETGRLLGFEEGDFSVPELRLLLAPGETLAFYTDGFTEAREPDSRTMFGVARLKEVVRGFDGATDLAVCADDARAAVEQFTRTRELQDDLTLLLLRRITP